MTLLQKRRYRQNHAGLYVPTPSVWTPASLSNLLIWLDASDAPTVLLSGSNVTGWNDKSGNSNNFTIAGTGNPTYSATSFPGSKPGIAPTVNNALRRTSQALNSAVLSCFVVYSMTAAQSFPGIVTLQGASNGNDFSSADSFSLTGGNNSASISVDRGGSPSYNGTRTITTGTARSAGIVFNGTQGITYGDFSGTTAANSSTSALGNTTANIALGARQASGGGIGATYFTAGIISEVIITTSAITGTDLTNLQAYWTAKWGTP